MQASLSDFLTGCFGPGPVAGLRLVHCQGGAGAFRALLDGLPATALGAALSRWDLDDPELAYLPFCPFLPAARRAGGQLGVAEWGGLQALPAHERSLARWLRGESPDRDDFPSAGDIAYERERLFGALAGLLEALSQADPFVLAVLNAQRLPRESVQLLDLLAARNRCKALIVLHYDWDRLDPEQREEPWLLDYRTRVMVSHGFLSLPGGPTEPRQPRLAPRYAAAAAKLALCREFLACQSGLELSFALAADAPQDGAEAALFQFHWGWFHDRLLPSKSGEAAFSRAEAVTHYRSAVERGAEGSSARAA